MCNVIKKAGGIIVAGNKLYLVLKGNILQFTKGHVEEGESLLDCAKREVQEETGYMNLKLIDTPPFQVNYEYKNLFGRIETVELTIYIFALSDDKRVKSIWMFLERLTGKWMTIEEALEQPTYENVKNCLLEIRDRLKILNIPVPPLS